MPRKRALEERIAEAEEKMERLSLEKNIRDLRAKVRTKRIKRR